MLKSKDNGPGMEQVVYLLSAHCGIFEGTEQQKIVPG